MYLKKKGTVQQTVAHIIDSLKIIRVDFQHYPYQREY